MLFARGSFAALGGKGVVVNEPLHEDASYSVGFNTEAAWSLTYVDSDGKMGFSFEPGDEQKQVYLNAVASVDGKMPGRAFYVTDRYKLALQRTKEYLVSCGYVVSIE